MPIQFGTIQKILVKVVFATLVLFSSYAHAKDDFTVRVGDFYPNYFKDKQGTWQGIDVELAKLLLDTAKIKHKFVNVPWSRALLLAENGTINMLVNANITSERSDFLYWIGPERYTQLNLVVRKEHKNLKINSLDDLVSACQQQGKSFGYQRNVKYSNAFMQRLSTDEAFKNCMAPAVKPLNDDKVIHQRLLGYFDEPLDILREKALNPDYGLVVLPFVAIKEPVFFALSKASVNVDTLLKLHMAYETIAANGSLQAVRDRWHQDQLPVAPDRQVK